MPTTHPSSQPKQLSDSNGKRAHKVMLRRRDGLTGTAVYDVLDIVRVDTTDGTIAKFVSTTAADATRLASAHNPYNLNSQLVTPPASTRKWQKVDLLEGLWTMNMVGTVATDPAGQTRNVAYDTTDGVVKAQAGATSPAVLVVGFAGEAAPGDTNPPVVVRWLDAARYAGH
jgi:hypothetical protein